jgi:NDP-sugar pyrophosphorylase family protein
MQAIILAGGMGTRLRPLTYTVPKPMLPVAGKPAIVHTVERLAEANFSEVIITTNYLAEAITEGLRDWNLPIPVRCIKEDHPLGTAGCIRNIIDLMDDDFLVIQGDAVADMDYAAFVQYHRDKEADVTISVIQVQDTREFGIVQTGEDGRIERFQEKPLPEQAFSDLANSGFYMLKKRVFDDVPANELYDFSLQLFPKLMAENARFYAWRTYGFWIDIGRIHNYVEGNVHGIKGRAEVAPDAQIAETATLVPPFLIGAGTRIGEHCIIGPHAVLGARCKIGDNAQISGSVIFSDVQIGHESRLNDCIVAHNSTLGNNVVIGPMAVIGDGCDIGDRVQIRAHSKVGPVVPVASGTIVDGIFSPRMERIEGLQRLLESNPAYNGLTSAELRVCALLTEFGELTARAISDGARCPYSRIHALLYSLEEQHVVLSTLDMPKRYALTREGPLS